MVGIEEKSTEKKKKVDFSIGSILCLYIQVHFVHYYGVCREFGWVRFLVVCFLYKPILTHEKLFAVGKSGPHATFNLLFLGWGWPWVGEFDGFIIISICSPTRQNLEFGISQHPSV